MNNSKLFRFSKSKIINYFLLTIKHFISPDNDKRFIDRSTPDIYISKSDAEVSLPTQLPFS